MNSPFLTMNCSRSVSFQLGTYVDHAYPVPFLVFLVSLVAFVCSCWKCNCASFNMPLVQCGSSSIYLLPAIHSVFSLETHVCPAVIWGNDFTCGFGLPNTTFCSSQNVQLPLLFAFRSFTPKFSTTLSSLWKRLDFEMKVVVKVACFLSSNFPGLLVIILFSIRKYRKKGIKLEGARCDGED